MQLAFMALFGGKVFFFPSVQAVRVNEVLTDAVIFHVHLAAVVPVDSFHVGIITGSDIWGKWGGSGGSAGIDTGT